MALHFAFLKHYSYLHDFFGGYKKDSQSAIFLISIQLYLQSTNKNQSL